MSDEFSAAVRQFSEGLAGHTAPLVRPALVPVDWNRLREEEAKAVGGFCSVSHVPPMTAVVTFQHRGPHHRCASRNEETIAVLRERGPLVCTALAAVLGESHQTTWARLARMQCRGTVSSERCQIGGRGPVVRMWRATCRT